MSPRLVRAGLVALAAMACTALAALPGNVAPSASSPTGVQHAQAAPRIVGINLNTLLLPRFTASTKLPTHTPAPSKRARATAKGNGPGESSTRNHHKAIVVTGNPRVAGVAWEKECSTAYDFCAEFPYAAGWPKGTFQTHNDYTSGTSETGFLHNFTGNLYVADNGHGYCRLEFTKGCNPMGTNDEYFFVEVIVPSKYAADPWLALTKINEGVHQPVRFSYQGHLASSFARDIYGGPGETIWYHGRVYYLGTGNGNLTPNNPVLVKAFLRGIHFLR